MRDDLPTGTVTFVFTDVEGSTRLLHSLGAEAYADALAEHRRVIREACAVEGGAEVDTQGDAFFFAFPTAPGALAAAASLTESLEPGPIHVRVGLHTGTPLVTDEGYVGDDVHRAARIAAVGHGGQVLVAASTAVLVGFKRLVDLGEHRFKDFAAPVRVYQFGEETFPPLKSLYRSNLPLAANPLVGRKRELADVLQALLDGARAVTITGPGGVGKTRFALAVAEEAADAFPDGVWFVPLASLHDHTLVLPTVAGAMGVDGDVARHIGDGQCLLLLDNFEHIVDAAPELAAIAGRCPRVRLLVTSREALRIAVEREYPLAPLPESPSVELFRQRANAVAPGVEIDYASAAAICDRLDRLPLAIELAAARCKALSAAQILERVSESLDLLRGGRDADPRQQTLRTTIEWSYGLLSEQEQRLFRVLSVFAGGCTLEAAETVCEADLDTLQSLVEKSLLRFTDGRYWMLETIRQYAGDRLREASGGDDVERRHVDYFMSLAALAESDMRTEREAEGVARLETEIENIRAALDAVRAADDVEREAEFVGALGDYWYKRGYVDEGLARVSHLLSVTNVSPELRLKIARTAALVFTRRGDLDEARSALEERLELARLLGDVPSEAASLVGLGIVTLDLGDSRRARELFVQAEALARQYRLDTALASALANLAALAWRQGSYEVAREQLAEMLALEEARQDLDGQAMASLGFGLTALYEGIYEEAAVRIEAALALFARVGSRSYVPLAYDALAAVCAASDPVRAARLLGAADALRAETGLGLDSHESDVHERAETAVRDALDAKTFESEREIGRTSPID